MPDTDRVNTDFREIYTRMSAVESALAAHKAEMGARMDGFSVNQDKLTASIERIAAAQVATAQTQAVMAESMRAIERSQKEQAEMGHRTENTVLAFKANVEPEIEAIRKFRSKIIMAVIAAALAAGGGTAGVVKWLGDSGATEQGK